MPRKSKDQSRTSLIIAAVAHVILIGAVTFWAYKTGQIEKIARILGVIPQQRKSDPPKQQDTTPKAPTQQNQQAQLPPIASAPQPSGGTRRAVSGEAPSAVGGNSFFQDTRTQVAGPSTGGSGPATAAATPPPPPPKAPPRTDLLPPRSTGAGSVVKLDRERMTAKRVQDAIGAEQISRTAGSSSADVVSKLTGTTIVDGKFVVVRGLSDRYTSTTLNGGDIPSADPYRKSVQLDLVPANMVESIVVTKTFTPDQPGGFTGGAINIVTKSFPERRVMTFSAGTTFNTQTTFSDYLTSNRGKDWIGMDDGSRSLSPALEGITPNQLIGVSSSGRTRNKELADRVQMVLQELGVGQFAGVYKKASPNQSYSFAMGDTVNLFTKPLGFFLGVNYKRDYSTYGGGRSTRYSANFNNPEISRDMAEVRGTEETAWGSVVNLAYRVHPEHELGFTFIYNQVGEDTARRLEGFTSDAPTSVLVQEQLFYTERNLNTYQFKGKHSLPEVRDSRIDWLVSLSNTSQEEPDISFFNYLKGTNFPPSFQLGNSVPDPIRPSRYFRDLNENNLNWKVDYTLPLRFWRGLQGEFKWGLLQSLSERTFTERTYSYAGDGLFPLSGDPNRFLNPNDLNYDAVPAGANTNYFFAHWFDNPTIGNNRYNGSQDVGAGYLMTEVPMTSWLKMVGGARYETTDLQVTAFNPNSGSTNGAVKAFDLLPALGLTLQIRSNVNLRLNYGGTLARPTYREFAPVTIYDVVTDTLVVGNPRLKRSTVQNYDIRLEWFPRAGEVLSIGGFYKKIKDPIERFSEDITDGTVTFENAPKATVYGVEFEARKNLDFLDPALNYFSLGLNYSIIQSEVDIDPVTLSNKRAFGYTGSDTRPLYDQSPYVLNADLTYNNPGTGTSVTLSTGKAGKRVFVATGSGADVYEHPPMSLDLVIGQKLTQNLRLRFTARNLLDPVYRRTYSRSIDDTGLGFNHTSYKRGRSFGVSLTYDF